MTEKTEAQQPECPISRTDYLAMVSACGNIVSEFYAASETKTDEALYQHMKQGHDYADELFSKPELARESITFLANALSAVAAGYPLGQWIRDHLIISREWFPEEDREVLS